MSGDGCAGRSRRKAGGRSAAWLGGRSIFASRVAPDPSRGGRRARSSLARPGARGVHTAYYLIHSMGSGREYDGATGRAPAPSPAAARAAGIARIVYLGGLGHGDRLSRHLASRQEVGRILRESGVPTVEFRASIVIGSGSLSFELVRALVEKLPVMVTPSWVDTTTQPIGIEDLVAYLVAALDLPGDRSAIYEIGGPDRVSYGDLMREYGRLRGLRAQNAASAGAHAATLQPLARPGDAALRRRRAGADRRCSERDRGTRHPGAPGLRRAAPRSPRSIGARAGERGPELCGYALVRRALLPAHAPVLGRGPVRISPGGFPGRVGGLLSPGGISPHRPDRRQDRVVLR